MTAYTEGVVMRHFLSAFIPKVSIIRTLPYTNLAIDTELFVSINAKFMVILIGWLKQQSKHLICFRQKSNKNLSYRYNLEPFFTIEQNVHNIYDKTTLHVQKKAVNSMYNNLE